MVRAFKNYGFAKDAWHYLVVPALHGVPRYGTKSSQEVLTRAFGCSKLFGIIAPIPQHKTNMVNVFEKYY